MLGRYGASESLSLWTFVVDALVTPSYNHSTYYLHNFLCNFLVHLIALLNNLENFEVLGLFAWPRRSFHLYALTLGTQCQARLHPLPIRDLPV